MESLSGTIGIKSGLAKSWDGYKNPNSRLVFSEILGWILPELEDQAIKYGWFVKRNGRWAISRENVISQFGGTGYSYNKGDTVSVVNKGFLSYKQCSRDSNFESVVKNAPEEKQEDEERDEIIDKVRELF
jgi:hypothetical protein